jgi:hypothetical protein
MELRDLVVTPLWFLSILFLAMLVRHRFTDPITRGYFLPALFVRLVGALAVGCVYQFYYGGGDTFNFHTHGSRVIWEAFVADPAQGIALFFQTNDADPALIRRILFYHDPASFALIRIAVIFDLLTFSSYSATALFFAVISFFGAWSLFTLFYKQYPKIYGQIAFAILFLPSVFFWGGGLLKDTVTLAGLSFLTYSSYRLFFERRIRTGLVVLALVSIAAIASIKVYILLTFFPCLIISFMVQQLHHFRQVMIRLVATPFLLLLAGVLIYTAVTKATKENPKYNLSHLAETVRITAMDIRYFTGRNAGSGYDLGELDGSWQSIARLAPQAINVSLFRPYLWETKNPLMLLSALEAFLMLALTGFLFARYTTRVFSFLSDPLILFSFAFSISFALAVGVSTYNFGTLNRYKIPLIPFYLCWLFVTHYHLTNGGNPVRSK